QAEEGIRDFHVTGVQTCALPISDAVTPHSRTHRLGDRVSGPPRPGLSSPAGRGFGTGPKPPGPRPRARPRAAGRTARSETRAAAPRVEPPRWAPPGDRPRRRGGRARAGARR